MTERKREQGRGAGGTSRRAATWLAWSLAAISVAMFVTSIVVYVLVRSLQGTTGALGELLIFAPFLAFPLVGALIASKLPENAIGWICLTAGFFWMLIVLGDSIPVSVRAPAAIEVLFQWIWVPPVGLLGIYMILLFPDGKLPSRRWRPLAWLSGVVIVLLITGITFAPGPLEGSSGGLRNPFGLEGAHWIATAATAILPLFPLCILASASSLVLRYRRAGREVREQIKWLAFAASFGGLVYLGGLLSELLFAPEGLDNGGTLPLWVSLWRNALLLSYAGVPMAVGFAVLRYRLYDIDVVINRTLVYGALTVMLAVVYRGSIVEFEQTFHTLTGRESQLAVVISTLAMAALFNPLRHRIQSLVDRRFYRRKYDAAKTLEAFSARLRDETDLDTLEGNLVGLVNETMQPAYVSLWLRPDTAWKKDQASG